MTSHTPDYPTPEDAHSEAQPAAAAMDQDALLTAYALGELDAEGAAAVERLLEDDPSLRAEVDAIRALGGQLSSELASEPAPGLTDAQRQRVLEGGQGPEPDAPPVIFAMRRVWAGVGLAAAACLILAVWIPLANRSEDASQFSMREATVDGRGAPGASAAPAEEMAKLESRSFVVPGADAGGAHAFSAAVADAAAGREIDTRDREGTRRQRSVVAIDPQAAAPAPGGGGSGGIAGPGRSLGTPPPATSPSPVARPSAPPPTSPPSRGAQSKSGNVAQNRGPGSTALSSTPRRVSPDRTEDEAALPESPDRAGMIGASLEGEAYGRLVDNPFRDPIAEPLSTFSIDVDTASYANVRRIIGQGMLPPKDAVRIEEMINYFPYAYEPPTGAQPFSVDVGVNTCPWRPEHRLVRIGLKGRDVRRDMRPATNLVFLLDVSGSMNNPQKLGLVKRSIRLLLDSLIADDRVAIVVYAGASGLVLPSTYCDEKGAILEALDHLRAGGSTNGGAGIELAYRVAEESFIRGGVNRIILCTDGDFNVGVSDGDDLVRLIEGKRESGVFLSVLGFGTGNWQDDRMEKLSNAGNGNFAYIDTIEEATKVLVEDMVGTLVTIAKDVKIQVEFNPAHVGAYRLIGYANRMLAARDFNDDTKDAGEIGAGHTVTALYEVAPPDLASALTGIDELKYRNRRADAELTDSDEMLTVKLRYKAPDGDKSELVEHPVVDDGATLEQADEDLRHAAAVASFGMLLRDSAHKGDATWASVLDLATEAIGEDERDHRAAFVKIVQQARRIAERR